MTRETIVIIMALCMGLPLIGAFIYFNYLNYNEGKEITKEQDLKDSK
jgi:hypothetical protein